MVPGLASRGGLCANGPVLAPRFGSGSTRNEIPARPWRGGLEGHPIEAPDRFAHPAPRLNRNPNFAPPDTLCAMPGWAGGVHFACARRATSAKLSLESRPGLRLDDPKTACDATAVKSWTALALGLRKRQKAKKSAKSRPSPTAGR